MASFTTMMSASITTLRPLSPALSGDELGNRIARDDLYIMLLTYPYFWSANLVYHRLGFTLPRG